MFRANLCSGQELLIVTSTLQYVWRSTSSCVNMNHRSSRFVGRVKLQQQHLEVVPMSLSHVHREISPFAMQHYWNCSIWKFSVQSKNYEAKPLLSRSYGTKFDLERDWYVGNPETRASIHFRCIWVHFSPAAGGMTVCSWYVKLQSEVSVFGLDLHAGLALNVSSRRHNRLSSRIENHICLRSSLSTSPTKHDNYDWLETLCPSFWLFRSELFTAESSDYTWRHTQREKAGEALRWNHRVNETMLKATSRSQSFWISSSTMSVSYYWNGNTLKTVGEF